jgi:SAM-dependent methyltransferase
MTMGTYEQGLARVANVWAEQAASWYVGRGLHWVEHNLVQERINLKAGADPGIDRYHHFVRKYFSGKLPVERALTLGCGAGEFERGLASYNFCRHHDAVDISGGAIEHAISGARAAGLSHINYRVDDLNRIVIEPDSYDVIFGISSVHHVSALEHLYGQVLAGLKPGGFFFMDEFIGPSQFQWTDSQLEASNTELRKLPTRFARSVTNPTSMKTPVVRPTIEFMNEHDPSEAVRSADIVALLPQYFEVVEINGQGGSLLHLLLEDIAGNFNEENEGSIAYLKGLFELEDQLINERVLQHDFATIIAQKRDRSAYATHAGP